MTNRGCIVQNNGPSERSEKHVSIPNGNLPRELGVFSSSNRPLSDHLCWKQILGYHRATALLVLVFFAGDMVTCKANAPTDQPSAHRPTQHHTGTQNSDDEHFESDPHTDKFNSIVNFKASIIKEGNLGVDGVQGRLKPSLHFWSETL